MSKWFAAFGVGMVDTECFETRFDRIKRYEGKNEASWPFPSKEVTVTKETRVPMNGLAQPDKDGWIENTQTEPGCPEHLKGKRVEVSRGMGNVKGNAEAWDHAWSNTGNGNPTVFPITHYRIIGDSPNEPRS